MSDKTKIEWTDATWNPITGCSVVSAGCKHCYAMKLAGTRLQHHPSRAGLTQPSAAGPVWTGEVRFNEQWLRQPMRWSRPRMIFVCAHGDLFHESVPDVWINRVFAVMALCPEHTFQVLTKRAGRMRDYLSHSHRAALVREHAIALCGEYIEWITWPLPNVWLGVSVENQAAADERIPLLLDTPAAVRWVSAEPLLGPVDLSRWLDLIQYEDGAPWGRRNIGHLHDMLDWVVIGGESGQYARPMHPDWARSIRNQCQAAGIPFLFKQWGEWLPAASGHGGPARGAWGGDRFLYGWGDIQDNDNNMVRAGKRALGSRTLDGVVHDARPEICQQ